MAGIHPSPPLYVIQPFKVPEAVFQRACEFLSIQDILTAATSCRQLHEWIWKKIPRSVGNPSPSVYEISRKFQCVQASVLFNKLAVAIRQDMALPITPYNTYTRVKRNNTYARINRNLIGIALEKAITALEKTAREKIIRPIKILYTGYLYPVEREKKEADEKSTAASHSSDQTAITVTTGGLITLWKQLPSADLSAKDVVHHANIIPDEYRENDPKVEQIYHFQHILLVKISVSIHSLIRGCFVACYDLRKYTAGKFANLVYQNRLGQDVVLEQTKDATFWSGHMEGTFFIGHNKEKERCTLSSFYFDRQQGILKQLWIADAHPNPNIQIEIFGKLMSNDGAVIVPVNSGNTISFFSGNTLGFNIGYGMSVMCARTGKALSFIDIPDVLYLGDNNPASVRLLLGSIIAYQRPGKLSLVNIFGKSLPDIEIFGQVTSVTHDVQLVSKKKTYSVKTNQNVAQVEREVIDRIATLTINYCRRVVFQENRQLVLRSDELQSPTQTMSQNSKKFRNSLWLVK